MSSSVLSQQCPLTVRDSCATISKPTTSFLTATQAAVISPSHFTYEWSQASVTGQTCNKGRPKSWRQSLMLFGVLLASCLACLHCHDAARVNACLMLPCDEYCRPLIYRLRHECQTVASFRVCHQDDPRSVLT